MFQQSLKEKKKKEVVNGVAAVMWICQTWSQELGGCLRQHLPPLQASAGSGAGQAGHAACPHATTPVGKWDLSFRICLLAALEAAELTHLGATRGRSHPWGSEGLEAEAASSRLSCRREAACDIDVEGAGDRRKLWDVSFLPEARSCTNCW